MSHTTAPTLEGFQAGRLTPPEINALLFYRLGQFVVWGREHGNLAAADPDLSALLESAIEALSRGGILEPGSWIPPMSNSQNLASRAESRDEL